MKEFKTPPIQILKLDETFASQDKTVKVDVQLMRAGNYQHPFFGEFQITKDIFLKFIENFKNKTRGVDLAIDYAHEADKEAAGWINDLYLKEENGAGNEELWANVLWTPQGKQTLEGKEYRYLSADFTFEYTDTDGVNHGPTLFGAGLTNRPFIKNMEPVVNLQEKQKGENTMDPKDKMIADLQAQIADLKKQLESKAAPSELEVELANTKKMLADMQAKEKQAAEEKMCAEKKAAFDLALKEGKFIEAQREAFMSGDVMKLTELAQPIKLSTEGNGKEPDPELTKEEKVLKLAEKLVADKVCADIGEAYSKVLLENENLR